MLTTNEIRHRFLNFFKSKGHEIVRSSSLVPADDPTLLFTNAGMVQFKGIFQGQEKRAYSRATTAQKCLRVGGKHNDLENVGRTARHHTFFEMLGNFSFGDYFKDDAIKFAWEFVTKELGLPADKLYATVYKDDDEAIELWLKNTTIPQERILRLGEKDNFWTMGDTGPCGPCSEILIDQGEHMSCGPDCGIGKCDCDRFLEIWNLVFMQYNQIEPGKREPLPRPSIDTGMGLERVSAVCQGEFSNYDSDLFRAIIDFAANLAGVSYSKSAPDTNDIDTALRVIADHSRAIAFMIADGIMPSNEGRGYILRRLIRRAYRFGRSIGMPNTFLHKTALKVVDNMKADFPELATAQEFMARVVQEEEERFEKTLDKGLALLEEALETLSRNGSTELSGDVTFKLYDTYGFPIDIINDVTGKRGISIDEDKFNALMQDQKERAKAARKGALGSDINSRFAALLEEGIRSEFVGYNGLSAKSRITAMLDVEGERVSTLESGTRGWIVVGQTPFYGASGGQVGDEGTLSTATGKAEVAEALKPSAELTMHLVEVTEGSIHLDAEAELTVQKDLRLSTARNHTCTHLLHSALRSVLGEHARQAGSLVGPDRLRFDFTHITGMTDEELLAVEDHVNRAIMADRPVRVQESSYDDAVKGGAMALFGEKYGDVVRSVQIEDECTELCGGTHLERTGQAGCFAILSESGVAANTRRIEAATGWNAVQLLRSQRNELKQVTGLLKARPGENAEKIQALQAEVRTLRKNLEKAGNQTTSNSGKNLMDDVREINGVKVLAAKTGATSVKALRDIADDVRSKIGSGLAALAMVEEDKVSLIILVTKDLVTRFNAPALIKEVAGFIGGSGGGRPDMAQAGGSNPAGIEDALTKFIELVGKE